MATCKVCSAYYKLTVYNNSDKCNDCVTDKDLLKEDYEDLTKPYEADIIELTNPTGRTAAVYID